MTKRVEVTVKYLGVFATYTGKTYEDIELPSKATIKDLGNALTRKYGEPLKTLLGDISGDNTIVRFAINGVVATLSGSLAEGDEVTMFIFVSGGG